MRPLDYIFLILLLFTGANAVAQTEFITIEPSQDNTLYEDDDGDNLSNGVGQHLFFGLTGPNAGNVLRRAVLAYDLSVLPADTEIISAELRVTVNMVPLIGTAASFEGTLHRLVNDWGEGTSDAPGVEGGGTAATTGDATWIHTFFPDMLWSEPGGDFLALPSASTQFSDAEGTFNFSSDQLRDDTQDMLDNPQDNFGWIIIGDEANINNARRIASRENLTLDSRPVLVIEIPEEIFFVDGFETLN